MTYGQQFPPQPAKAGPLAALAAPVTFMADKLRIIGTAIGAAGLFLIVFSCLTWISSSEDGTSMTISGLGSVSIDASGPMGAWMSGMESEISKEMSAPGVWTLIFGILLIGAAVPLIIQKFQGYAALAAALLGFITFVTAVTFFGAPVWALTGESNDLDGASRGYGLWVVLLVSVVALAAGIVALLMVVMPGKFGTPTPPASAQFGQGAPPQQYGVPQQFGVQQPQYGQQQPGYMPPQQYGAQQPYPPQQQSGGWQQYPPQQGFPPQR